MQGCTERLCDRRGRVTILTPHDGEFARLTGKTLREIASSERLGLASRFACEHGCILVLKGHRTRIALPDGQMLVNTSGCSALSKGGSGDVLTGLIASLLCQGAGAAQAAALPYSFQYFIVHSLILISEMIVCFLSAKRSTSFYWRNDRLMLWAKAIVFSCRALALCKSTIFW